MRNLVGVVTCFLGFKKQYMSCIYFDHYKKLYSKCCNENYVSHDIVVFAIFFSLSFLFFGTCFHEFHFKKLFSLLTMHSPFTVKKLKFLPKNSRNKDIISANVTYEIHTKISLSNIKENKIYFTHNGTNFKTLFAPSKVAKLIKKDLFSLFCEANNFCGMLQQNQSFESFFVSTKLFR